MECRRAFAFVAFALLASAIGLATNACSTKSCTLVGCQSGAAITVHPAAGAALTGATFAICLNGKCSSGVAGGGEAGPASDPSHIVMNGDVGIQTADVSGSNVVFDYREDESNPATKIHTSGDTYRVSIIGADKSTLVDATRTVTYPNTSQPNGPDCDPTCHNATVDVAPQ